jgi:hypothetical protein
MRVHPGYTAVPAVLADRPAPTPYSELNRGLLRMNRIHEAIIRDLDRQAVRLIVQLDAVFEEPNKLSIASGIDLLDRYLATHYRQVGVYRSYVLLERRN